jgi:hypothetical protein
MYFMPTSPSPSPSPSPPFSLSLLFTCHEKGKRRKGRKGSYLSKSSKIPTAVQPSPHLEIRIIAEDDFRRNPSLSSLNPRPVLLTVCLSVCQSISHVMQRWDTRRPQCSPLQFYFYFLNSFIDTYLPSYLFIYTMAPLISLHHSVSSSLFSG